jgi:hypothetical protein
MPLPDPPKQGHSEGTRGSFDIDADAIGGGLHHRARSHRWRAPAITSGLILQLILYSIAGGVRVCISYENLWSSGPTFMNENELVPA